VGNVRIVRAHEGVRGRAAAPTRRTRPTARLPCGARFRSNRAARGGGAEHRDFRHALRSLLPRDVAPLEGRSSGSRIIRCDAPSQPKTGQWLHASIVPGYSDGLAPDSHRLPVDQTSIGRPSPRIGLDIQASSRLLSTAVDREFAVCPTQRLSTSFNVQRCPTLPTRGFQTLASWRCGSSEPSDVRTVLDSHLPGVESEDTLHRRLSCDLAQCPERCKLAIALRHEQAGGVERHQSRGDRNIE